MGESLIDTQDYKGYAMTSRHFFIAIIVTFGGVVGACIVALIMIHQARAALSPKATPRSIPWETTRSQFDLLMKETTPESGKESEDVRELHDRQGTERGTARGR